MNGGVGNDGLAQRLQVLVYPDPLPTYEYVDRAPDAAAMAAVESVFRRLSKMNAADPRVYRFAPDAQQVFADFLSANEIRGRAGELPSVLEAHLGKYGQLMPKLALIFHLVEEPDGNEIGFTQAQRAAAMCDYLESHAKRVYASVAASQDRGAGELAGLIKKGELGQRFRLREVYNRGLSLLKTPAQVGSAAKALVAAGWIRQKPVRPGRQGGRPTEEYIVNPKVPRA